MDVVDVDSDVGRLWGVGLGENFRDGEEGQKNCQQREGPGSRIHARKFTEKLVKLLLADVVMESLSQVFS